MGPSRWCWSRPSADPTTLFLEAWGQAAGSDYLYYRWVLQAGSATFQGYDASDGFLTIGSMGVDFVDDTHVMLGWLAEDMALFSNDFSLVGHPVGVGRMSIIATISPMAGVIRM